MTLNTTKNIIDKLKTLKLIYLMLIEEQNHKRLLLSVQKKLMEHLFRWIQMPLSL